ncbi:MAG TPA: RidA family protein [Xanthobacteraceae bacterium]|jgi:enamine deaminase RidA (YjgF/YER057c/UK114 family)
MTIEYTPSTSASANEPGTSRREVVAAAVTLVAATGAVSSTPAEAQTASVRHTNPPGMSSPPTYSQVVEVNGPHRIVFLAGQTGQDTNGKVVPGGIRPQATRVMENIKTALASVGGGFEHIVKLNTYMLDIDRDGPAYREVRTSYFSNKSTLPASTLLQVSRLANPEYLLEVEVLAILPPKA